MHAIEYQTACAWFLLLLSITPTALLIIAASSNVPGFLRRFDFYSNPTLPGKHLFPITCEP